jgi:hypothetical protein
MMKRLAVLLLAGSGSAAGADFLDDPKALCGYFDSLGMKAQFQWGPAPQGGAFVCQYADEFSGDSTHVRAGQVYVDPATKTVGLGLSIQSLGGNLVRAEAADVLVGYVQRFYAAHERPLPAPLTQLLAAPEGAPIQDGALSISNTDAALWQSHHVVGASWKRPATAAQLAALSSSVSADEKAAASGTRERLQARCSAAVAASGQGADPARLQRKVTPLSASRILVELSDASGSFVCQVCDEMDPKVQCGTMGVMLSFRGADGSQLSLPAEIRQKCEYHLQKEVMPGDAGVFIDQAIVRRIQTREVPNDKRYVYEHELDGASYRCVVRKSDLSFSLERRLPDGQWRGLVGGIMP